MDTQRWIGMTIVAAAVGHVAARVLRRWQGRGRRSAGAWLVDRLGGLDDLAPGRLVHGQGVAGDGRS